MKASSDAARFIESTFRSVWALELLLHLRRSPDQAFTSDDLVAALRASDAVISQGIRNLVAAGLIVEDDEGRVRYGPASSDLEGNVKAAENLYRVRPDAVRRFIVDARTRGLAAFSDAFKIRGD
jgi:hypothetical protein